MKFCLSEADAKTKWCPMTRQLGTLSIRELPSEKEGIVSMGSQNRGYQMGRALPNCMCLASDCMMWRWVRTNIKDADGNITVPSDDTHGYCGLAGVPAAAR